MDNTIKQSALNWIFPSIGSRMINKDDFCFRIEKAREQFGLPACPEKKIIGYVNEFLTALGMACVKDPEYFPRKVDKRLLGIRRINYSNIWTKNKPYQVEKEDIVWIKFVENKDNPNNRHICVVGVGCDISFTEHTKKNTSSGKILDELKLEWDDNEILIFPLMNIPLGLKRSDIESGIGNYLISKGVPILDFYSHNF